MTASDPTPGDHDALLTDIESRIDFYHLNNEPHFEAGSEVDLMFQAAKALRTEQSALQQRIDAALALLDQLIWNEEDLGAVAFVRVALTTESKEPEPKLVGPMPQIARARVITLCGSTKFKDAINAENARLTMEGNLVISLGLFGHTDLPDYNWDTDVSDLKRTLDAIHAQKIDMADSVHVVNPGGYYGESTAREIAYARVHGKPVTFMEPTDYGIEAPHD